MISFDHTTGESTWITPPQIQQALGHFDLDPCAADDMPYRTADRMVTKDEDGLKVDWTGKRVWLNPPYGKWIIPFLQRMRLGIALLPCRTDTGWFHDLVLPRCHSILLVRGRIKFIAKDLRKCNSPAFASILVSYSKEDTEILGNSDIQGKLMIPYR